MEEDLKIQPVSMHSADYIRISSLLMDLQMFGGLLKQGSAGIFQQPFAYLDEFYTKAHALYYEWFKKIGNDEAKKFLNSLSLLYNKSNAYKIDAIEALQDREPPENLSHDILMLVDEIMQLIFLYKYMIYDSKEEEKAEEYIG